MRRLAPGSLSWVLLAGVASGPQACHGWEREDLNERSDPGGCLMIAGTVFDGGDIALFLGIAAGVVVLVLVVVFALGWVGGRTVGRK